VVNDRPVDSATDLARHEGPAVEAAPPTPVGRMLFWGRHSLGWYLLAVAIAAIGTAAILRPWVAGGVFVSGDAAFQQSAIEIVRQVGLFDIDTHLGWSGGVGFWSVPQLGYFLGWGAQILTGIGNMPAATALLWLLVASAAATASACLFFLRSIKRSVSFGANLLAVALAVAIGASPAVTMIPGHLNVAPWFVVPVALGAVIRLIASGDRSVTRQAGTVALVFLAGAISPAWWLFVVILLIAAFGAVQLVVGKWRGVAVAAAVAVGLALGAVIQFLAYSSVPSIASDVGRSAWSSNKYGGYLVDIFRSSPFVNEQIPALNVLDVGSSTEFKPVGVLAGAAVVVTVIVVLSGWLLSSRLTARADPRATALSVISPVVLLTFVTGGLGNLQAGLFVLVGSESPGRAWSRLMVVVALAGAAWILVIVSRAGRSQWASSWRQRAPAAFAAVSILIPVVLIVVWFVDTRALFPQGVVASQQGVVDSAEVAERGAVEFVRAQGPPCPTLQLPVTNGVEIRTKTELTIADTAYRGYVPYLLAPDLYWSYGSVSADQLAKLRKIPKILPTDASKELRAQGYCAVLFDSFLASELPKKQEKLPGMDVASLGAPDYDGGRFQVFELGTQ
jgi:hypothetical protein